MSKSKNASLEIAFLHANWCGHCHSFRNEWQQLLNFIDGTGKIYNGVKIIPSECEERDFEKNGKGKINGESITGYPTIVFTLWCNGVKKDYDFADYGIKREAVYMAEFIKNVCNELAKCKK
jgi:hypothetical protein